MLHVLPYIAGMPCGHATLNVIRALACGGVLVVESFHTCLWVQQWLESSYLWGPRVRLNICPAVPLMAGVVVAKANQCFGV